MNADYRRDELIAAIAARRALIIAGAGVSLTATDNTVVAGWKGLLLNGIERCRSLGQVTEEEAAALCDGVNGNDVDEMIRAAQDLQDHLEKIAGGHFRKWLKGTVGSLDSIRPGILQVIADLGVCVATTNYDDLLTSAIGGRPTTWRDTPAIQRIARGDETGVIHLHGKWDIPESVVLGVDSYSAAVGDLASQEITRALFASNSVIFIGFGAGLSDPNFAKLRSWCREVLRSSDYPPTLLVRDDQVRDAAAEFGPDGFQVLGYGEKYEDLELYLADLKPTTTAGIGRSREYTWTELGPMLGRLHRRITRDFRPDVVLAMSGPGNFAPQYCLSLDPEETPVLTAVTFPKGPPRSSRNLWFQIAAKSANWHHVESRRWDVFLPNVLTELPKPSRILIFDDRAIGGNVQRVVQEWLHGEGHEVRRAAIIVHPDISSEVDWYEEETEDDFKFPWGARRGRS